MSRRQPWRGGSPARKQPLLLKKPAKASKCAAEYAGGKMAECVAVACCCPCGLINLLILTFVKLPARLLRWTMRKRKMRPELLALASKSFVENTKSPHSPKAADSAVPWQSLSPAAEVLEMEKKMWPQLFGTGFWRSPSQRD